MQNHDKLQTHQLNILNKFHSPIICKQYSKHSVVIDNILYIHILAMVNTSIS